MGLKLVTFILVIIGFYTTSSYQHADDICKTPDGSLGHCKVIHECEPLDSILRERPLQNSRLKLLQKSICGFQKIVPKVCCHIGSTESVPMMPDSRSVLTNKFKNILLPDIDECGAFTEERIVGGEEASIGEFPWTALLNYKSADNKQISLCGGTLINKRYILTAAHCVRKVQKKWTLTSVTLGEHDIEKEIDCEDNECAPRPEDIAIEEKIVHPDYDIDDLSQHNDIALLRLKRDVKYSDFIKPICLPTSPELRRANYKGDKFFVVGWGLKEDHLPSKVKLHVKLPIANKTDCVNLYKQVGFTITDKQLCAGGVSGQDACKGDSGGPLMTIYKSSTSEINWYAVGVVSLGPRNCGVGLWPGIYTKVVDYVDWISATIKA